MIYIIFSSIFSYLLGSINTAIILSKKLTDCDIRLSGSGNAGATNILRTIGKKAGAAVFLIDFSKGLLAVTTVRLLVIFSSAPYEAVLASGFFVQLGHIFPVFFRFKGGKGVATAAGAAMGIMPETALILLSAFTVIVLLTKRVSVASGICASIYPLLAFFISSSNNTAHFLFAASCSALILIKHIPNFVRLLDGTESKILTDKKRNINKE